MNLLFRHLLICLPILICCQCASQSPKPSDMPNVILIMADDMGYECLGVNGSTEYETPVLDELAAEGMHFTKCISQPLCTPSRVKIMTGQHNYRNYEYFTYLNPNQQTFGQLMQSAGYSTCIVGKWQLSGLKYELPGYQDSLRPHQLGFDEYCLWQLNHLKPKGERFADPLLQQNGKTLPRDPDAYGPDIVSSHALDFIERNQTKPFFVYYPMLLTHDPFVVTPDSEDWEDTTIRYQQDTALFADMVQYTDKIVGRFVQKLKELHLLDNTLLIFTADNGTHPRIYSSTENGIVRGAKGNTVDHGTHVPLVMSWPDKIQSGKTHDGLVGFADFYATLAHLVGKDDARHDGQSLLPLLQGQQYDERESLLVHYDPRWSDRVNQYRGQFARTKRYKLYQDGRFFDLDQDVMEINPIQNPSQEQKQIKSQLQKRIAEAPAWEDQ